jgi:hypothetical protein
MASLREHFTVGWDNREPVEVITTVLDLMHAVDVTEADGHPTNRVALETQMLYLALQREGHELPPYLDWMLLIDNYTKKVMVDEIDVPTNGVRLDTARSS